MKYSVFAFCVICLYIMTAFQHGRCITADSSLLANASAASIYSITPIRPEQPKVRVKTSPPAQEPMKPLKSRYRIKAKMIYTA